jgi:predicted adenylyl cyclase CyaB
VARNIEIKIACDTDVTSDVIARLNRHGVEVTETLLQTDTYFQVTHGRLKLRVIEGYGAELIQYLRPDNLGSRLSDYRRFPIATEHASTLLAALGESHGILATVHKTRRVAIWNSTRIHLDEVDGVGHFIELETVLAEEGADPVAAQCDFDEIVEWLGLARYPPIAGSYSDLVLTERLQI